MKHISIILISIAILLFSCEDPYKTINDPITYGETYFSADIETDKAVYSPGETIVFKLNESSSGSLKAVYSHLGTVVHEEKISGSTWKWTAPNEDFKGYMVEIRNSDNELKHSIAVDVSSDWKKFPRYGFVSSYNKLSSSVIANNINNLNRHHINGVQFYDWLYDHHRPLAGTVENPAQTWPDLMGRTNYFSTVKGYVDEAHKKGMKAMFYNLAFGALKNAASDGVSEEWYLFKDENRTEKDNHHLDAPFRSSIYITNPGNIEWQNYLSNRINDVYEVFNFDGFHIDQLGYRGDLYDFDGNKMQIDETYGDFISVMKENNRDKRLVMNSVSQYGQKHQIAKSEVDFLYNEVWDEVKTFEDLAQVILDNNRYSENSKATILAAYMNYAQSNRRGFVNMPGVLLANSVIFSFGGAHLELGEHYLTNEYFPNDNLQLSRELKASLVSYYDFLVGYQNLLRDGGEFKDYQVVSLNDNVEIENWPASQGKIAARGKKVNEKDVIHLINFKDANSMEWRDTNATQVEPEKMENIQIEIEVSANKVWIATPDVDGGVAKEIDFESNGNKVTITVPSLKYWTMIVIE